LGLEDAHIRDEARIDPGGRDGCRAPIPWQAEPPHGWQGAEPWLPFPPDAAELAAERQTGAANSIFALYQRLLAARKASPALHHGDFEELPSHPEVLAYRRQFADDHRLVCINFSDQPHAHPHAGDWHVEIASDGVGENAPYNGTLNPGQAVVLRPMEN
jgi:alpha-glucosidase